MKKRLLAALILLAATSARAIQPPKGAREDAKRFGLNHAEPVQRSAPSSDSARAFHAFNATHGGKWKVRFNPRTGLPAAMLGNGEGQRSGPPDAVARAFLAAHSDVLGVDPTTLILTRQTQGNGHQHVLYRQKYNGIPVEFAGVKVHIDAHGSVLGVHSTYEPNLSVPTVPLVTANAAARSAAADARAGIVRGAPTLAIVPLESDGKNHLAWKMRVDSPAGGGWRYYVDAITGQVLFRYSVREFFSLPPPCLSSGVVTGAVFDLDPAQTPGPVVRPFNDQYVYLGSGPSRVVTSTDTTYQPGFFCGQVNGKTAMSLQGPWISIGQFRGPNAHYDDGGGIWSTVATPIGSPHPYPVNANITSTINLAVLAPTALEFIPVFADFAVGNFDGGSGEGSGDIVQDDRLMISNVSGEAIANYIGARGAFNGAAVHGRTMNLTLSALSGAQGAGYDIAVSSYLTMPSPDTDGAPLSSHTWTGADTFISGQQGRDVHGEISLFYHLNLMHDYFTSDVDKLNAAPINKPLVAMAHVGPNLLNAFYDPDYDDLSFGDVNELTPSDMFMDDATVPHHEYTHYVVQKIWDIQNFGQAGALSEGNADYWSASSLDDPAIGTYVIQSLGGSGPLRQIDDQVPGALFYNLGNPATVWSGEIHDDSPFFSQALWDIRRAAIAPSGLNLGHNTGRSCSDGLVFQALLYFPESFSEMYEDMLEVDRLGAVPHCGGANAAQAIITAAFAGHGLIRLGDNYEPNDGFETATDISTIGVVSATIFPPADTDFYSFGAGPGLVKITLSLPNVGGGLYKDYQLKLYNVSRQQVAGAAPPSNGFGTLDGFCDVLDCDTTMGLVTISYNNPTGGLLYVQVIGGDSLNGSNSGVDSTIPYTLSVSYPQNGALGGALVTAKFDQDTIGFTVNTSSFVSNQDWRFAYAQLRNQSNWVMPNTVTHVPPLATDFLTFVSSQNAYGQITGSAQLVTGFASRFPSVGTIELEVFAYDVHGSTSSMGISNALNLSDNNQTELKAFNNLFNPLKGEKATVKYAVSSPGHVTIKLYTETGRLVLTLFDGDVTAGKGSVDWGGQNKSGVSVASGIYIVRAVGPGLNTTQKIAVIK